MRCGEVQERMTAFVLDDVFAKQNEHIATHLQTCAACQSWNRQVAEMLTVWEEAEPMASPDLVPSVISL